MTTLTSTAAPGVAKIGDKTDESLLQIVSFKIGGEEFGINILKVQEINRLVEITNLPNSPDFVEGVINLRGKVIPVISLRKRFHLPKLEANLNTRIVIVEVEGKIFGFIVDAVNEVLRIPADSIEPPPAMVSGVQAGYILGVAKCQERLLIIMDLDKVLSASEMQQLEA